MKKLFLLFFCLALQACMPQFLPPTTELRASAGEVVIIGKVELVPPINAKFEQERHWNAFGEDRMLNHVVIATGAENKPLTSSKLDSSEFNSSIEAKWGVPFMVKAPRQRTFINGGVTFLNVVRQEKLRFPGGYYFEVPSGAEAIYIGTLRYHRNDFNTITKVEVIDERQDIAAALKNTGSSALQVRPSLLKSVR